MKILVGAALLLRSHRLIVFSQHQSFHLFSKCPATFHIDPVLNVVLLVSVVNVFQKGQFRRRDAGLRSRACSLISIADLQPGTRPADHGHAMGLIVPDGPGIGL